ncbi:hypothetical protein SAMN02949497_2396 [Methylomagnum ishizawai]|uniref:Sulfotransferase family protein n=1 Tax=Methylomagnum ishizawai TaxID=1760988 RepID=A0A1Y6D3D1_9GAMM|nr:hypothetical protein [Methylomagnum ishizawai]SMF95052.1 hypothetical protein SAMN02949497_2396 [Methylomagnum ishizawai]
MREITMHIGRHKSGTSSLQHFLVKNESVLADLGYLYPKSMRTPKVAHHSLAEFFKNSYQRKCSDKEWMVLDNECKLFLKEIDGASKILLSSEAFQAVKPSEVKDFFGPAVNIIVYIREQFEYLISSYAQAVQNQKITLTLEEYEKRFFYDYSRFLKSWEDAFPTGKTTVRIYDRAELAEADIRLDFILALGLKKDNFIFDVEEKNPSIGGILLEFKRRLNMMDFESIVSAGKLYEILGKAAAINPSLVCGTYWNSKLIEEIDKKCLQPNKIVCEKFFPGRKTLFNRKAQFYEEKSVMATFDDVASTIDAIIPSVGTKLMSLISR